MLSLEQAMTMNLWLCEKKKLKTAKQMDKNDGVSVLLLLFFPVSHHEPLRERWA